MPTHKPMPPAAGIPLASTSASSSFPLTATRTWVPSIFSCNVIHSSSEMSAPLSYCPFGYSLAQPVELPVRIGEVLDRALFSRIRRILSSGHSMDAGRSSQSATSGVGDPIRKAYERTRVREPLPFRRLRMSASIVPFRKSTGMRTKVGMSTSMPTCALMAESGISTSIALRPLYSAGFASTRCKVAPGGRACRS